MAAVILTLCEMIFIFSVHQNNLLLSHNPLLRVFET